MHRTLFSTLLALTISLMITMQAEAAELEWRDQSGTLHSLAEYRGRAAIVHFWASWCGPCRDEMPKLTDWIKQHPDIAIIPISLDKSIEDAALFLRANRFELSPQTSDQAQAMGMGVRGLPTTMVIAADGSIAASQIGAMPWDNDAFSEKLLEKLKP